MQVHAKNNMRHNMQLLAGLGFLSFTLFVLSGRVNLNPEPKHLMK